mgnify:CR=1 FL=1
MPLFVTSVCYNIKRIKTIEVNSELIFTFCNKLLISIFYLLNEPIRDYAKLLKLCVTKSGEMKSYSTGKKLQIMLKKNCIEVLVLTKMKLMQLEHGKKNTKRISIMAIHIEVLLEAGIPMSLFLPQLALLER